jgi:hypothetical protein
MAIELATGKNPYEGLTKMDVILIVIILFLDNA